MIEVPAFFKLIEVETPEGNVPLDAENPDMNHPWRWRGNKFQIVKWQGRSYRLSTAVWMFFTGDEPFAGHHLRRRPDCDPDDFRPSNFYCKLTVSDFADEKESSEESEEDREAEDLAVIMEDEGVIALSELDEELWEDIDPAIIRKACEKAGVSIDMEVET